MSKLTTQPQPVVRIGQRRTGPMQDRRKKREGTRGGALRKHLKAEGV